MGAVDCKRLKQLEFTSKNVYCVRIMGPPALIYAAKMKDGLVHNARPIYNYSMKGVITCFTGIRKKDELTKLVKLIHSMGGGIRKDMNSKVTHLISNVSGGEKYQYAKTFRLTVLRSQWVHDAWEKRDEPQFLATAEDFTRDHKLKAFEGQKICFFGFPPDEHQHMLDVLRSNGGVPAELDDPDCSHVVMANTGGYFPENLSSSPTTITNQKTKSSSSPSSSNSLNNNNDNIEAQVESSDEVMDVDVDNSSSPKTPEKVQKPDGIVLRLNEKNEFQSPNNISPILGASRQPEKLFSIIENNISPIHGATPAAAADVDVEDDDEDLDIDVTESSDPNKDLKRKRESLDSMSIISVDSFALPMSVQSAKKPKLTRTGSITRSIKRSMSFVAVRTPIAKMLRHRRSSVDPDASISSITSLESTFNESIKKPVKEKLRGLRDRLTRSSSTISSSITSNKKSAQKSLSGKFTSKSKFDYDTPEKNENNSTSAAAPSDTIDFKTPKAPRSISKNIHQNQHPYHHHYHHQSHQNFNQNLNQLQSSSSELIPPPESPGVGPSINNSLANTNSISTATAVTTTTTTTYLSSNQQQEPLSSINQSQTQSLLVQPPVSISCTVDRILPAAAVASTTTTTRNDNECDISTLCAIDRGRLTVVDEHFAQAKPEPKNSRTHILKSDWFWYTIQNGYADEMDYLFGDYLDSIANTPNTDRRDSLPISFNKRKRKRFSQRIQLEGTPIGSGKRRSSVSDAGLLSVSGSFFDSTASPDKIESVGKIISEPESATEQTPKNKSMRFNHFTDFFSTESNYVGILDTIVHLFKNPLEEKAESSDALLNKSEIRAIFGNFIPIHEVHQRMLECLRDLHTKWREDCSIGEIILRHRDELIKAYPPYVNFFEQMKECLIHCDTQNPRFHAFLKINQAKPECGRQTLQDLMIRPVQRLPSISLLLNDILKHTNKNNPDYQKLEEALKAIKEVMAHINEDKRKTEGRMAIFDIFNDIEGCPAHLVSSNRSFISKCEVTELSDNLSGRGDSLMLYLFSDTIEVCKKRSRGFNSAKSPSTTKCFKHIKLMSLNAIRFVIDITDSPRAFAILCRQDKDKLHSFTIADEEIDKVVYLKTLCKQMAENACRTDTDKSLLFRTSQELEVDISDVNLSTLSKAFKLAARTRLKVGRAFSFNKTPSKLKRAVSTMMTSPFGSTNSLTPASQLAQMRLASCTNINEVVGEEDSRCGSPTSQSEVLVAPLSIQPTRKAKSSTMSMAGLRRI
ncbi:protein ECT2 isoform X2 [Eupeodes corollae]|uniref:protein ECT2 isoform X2 n=1 Tax=Eupeodes corollae TaxID=290404 RepID=UPI00249394DF|nr:protein ECT2 isoform X2 [Eupeodes corollae]